MASNLGTGLCLGREILWRVRLVTRHVIRWFGKKMKISANNFDVDSSKTNIKKHREDLKWCS